MQNRIWMWKVAFLLLAACGCQNKTKVEAQDCAWNHCPSFAKNATADSDVINVHVVCHTHDDMGWIVTVNEYFSRLRPDIIPIGVEFIFNTVLIELERDAEKRFSFAETGFLTRWVESHDADDVARLRRLIRNGQIELIGGGWTQPDEAASHYVELIDQYTLGLRILNESYGECGRPRVAWQIDPFGHSREHANIAVGIGYEALFFSRLHYREHEERVKNKSLEFIWSASDDLQANQIFTGQFFQGNYGPPPGYCFDMLCKDEPVIDSANLEGFNIDSKVDDIIKFVQKQAAAQRHRNVMLLMGGDFQYSNANMVFTSLDKLMKAVNAKTNVTKIAFRYSTPSCYVKAVTDSAPHLPQRTGDTFPHATANHSYWTGYFTSKPALKGLIRSASAFLQLTRAMDALALSSSVENHAALTVLEKAVALSQHHDAVTGTSKERVTVDYEKHLTTGWRRAESTLSVSLHQLSNLPDNVTLPDQTVCLQLNESICVTMRDNKKLAVTVYNGNSQPQTTIVRVPFYYPAARVKGPKGEDVEFEVQRAFLPFNQFTNSSAPFELRWPVSIPALGFKTYFVGRDKNSTRSGKARKSKKVTAKEGTDTTISNGIVEVTFGADGHLASFKNLRTNFSTELTQEFLYYESWTKNFPLDQSSGAYIFRPRGEAKRLPGNVTVEVVKGKFVQEVRQTVTPWISQVVRLSANQSVVEFDWIVGPIEKEAKNAIGKEVISRYSVKGLKNDGVFFTDSNGRQLIKRTRNSAPYYKFEKTEPISGNYYPVPSRISIADGKTQLVVLTDRSQGGTSLADGEVELMVHRRMYEDDNFGVEEALDEPGADERGLVARGRHWLLLESPTNAPKMQRELALELFHAPVLAFAPIRSESGYRSSAHTEFSGLQKPVPVNVHILTLKQLAADTVLLRLEHFLQNGEDSSLAQPVTVDLDQIFSTLNVLAVEELALAANVPIGETRQLPQSWNRSLRVVAQSVRERFAVQLRPMEIKTLRLHVQPRPVARR